MVWDETKQLAVHGPYKPPCGGIDGQACTYTDGLDESNCLLQVDNNLLRLNPRCVVHHRLNQGYRSADISTKLMLKFRAGRCIGSIMCQESAMEGKTLCAEHQRKSVNQS
jgi:hypothetical protein